jgi:pilus assembly protein CpaF
MRPDRILVGEVRGGEALDMLQAMNTGHRGSLTTAHANGAYHALLRLETMALMAGLDIPLPAVREQIRRGIDVVVHQERDAEGRRRIVQIVELDAEREGYVLREVAP